MVNENGFKVKVWHVILLSIIIGVGLAWGVTSLVKNVSHLKASAIVLENSIKKYEIQVNGLKEEVAEANALVVKRENDLILSIEQIERLKQENIRNVNVIGELRLQVSALKDSLIIRVPPDTITRYVEVIDDRPMMELPLYFEEDSEWLWMRSDIDLSGSGSMGFVLKDAPLNITLGSRGVFKKDYVSSISSVNPYVTVDKNNLQLVSPPKTKTALVGAALGVGLGALTTYLIMR